MAAPPAAAGGASTAAAAAAAAASALAPWWPPDAGHGGSSAEKSDFLAGREHWTHVATPRFSPSSAAAAAAVVVVIGVVVVVVGRPPLTSLDSVSVPWHRVISLANRYPALVTLLRPHHLHFLNNGMQHQFFSTNQCHPYHTCDNQTFIDFNDDIDTWNPPPLHSLN